MCASDHYYPYQEIPSLKDWETCNQDRNCSTKLVHLALALAAGRPVERLGTSWRAASSVERLDPWLPLAPLRGGSGLEWLDLAAPGALAGSIWPLCVLLGAPTGSISLPTFISSGTFLHASHLVLKISKNDGDDNDLESNRNDRNDPDRKSIRNGSRIGTEWTLN